MSLAASTRKAFAVDAEAKSPEFRKAATQTAVETGIEKITLWIPSEVVAIYVALLGIFAPSTKASKWTIFAVGALSVLVFTWLNAALVNKRGAEQWTKDNRPGDPPKLASKRIMLLILVALIAFVVWAFALPGTPFLTLTNDATHIGGGLVVVVSLLMPKLAELLDLKVPGT